MTSVIVLVTIGDACLLLSMLSDNWSCNHFPKSEKEVTIGKIWLCPHEPTNSLFKKQIKKLNKHLDCGAPTPKKSNIVAKLNNLNAKSGIHSCPFSTLFEKCSSSIHGYPKTNYHPSKHLSSN